jgi:hypothetical protein
MAETNDESTPSANKLGVAKHESFAHDEHAKDSAPEFADIDISYDSSGLKGIFNSPYVCGAALLASFGGFSFGYGEAVQNPKLQGNLLTYMHRPRCNFLNLGYAAIRRPIP